MQRWGKWLTAHCGKHIGRTLPACVANIIVFFVVGLWHGAESHFILWGLYNGLVIAASDLFTPVWDRMNKALHVNMEGRAHHVFCIVRTFIVVNIGWYFDRIVEFRDVLTAFRNTLFNFDFSHFASTFLMLTADQRYGGLALAACGTVIVFLISVLKENGIDVAGKLLAAPAIVRGLAWAGIVLFVATSFAFSSGGGFMYANF